VIQGLTASRPVLFLPPQTIYGAGLLIKFNSPISQLLTFLYGFQALMKVSMFLSKLCLQQQLNHQGVDPLDQQTSGET